MAEAWPWQGKRTMSDFAFLLTIYPRPKQEIEAFFRQFDADRSGRIERKELKACLYSLGEVCGSLSLGVGVQIL